VAPGDDADLAVAILRLHADQHAVRTMGMKARLYVAEHLNRHDQAAQLVSLLQSIAHIGRS